MPELPYRLDDAQARHRRSPNTFDVPTRAELRALGPGRLVKLLFMFRGAADADGCNGERMWVRITHKRPNGFVGTLDTDPARFKNLPRGAVVTFRPEHVAAIDDNN